MCRKPLNVDQKQIKNLTCQAKHISHAYTQRGKNNAIYDANGHGQRFLVSSFVSTINTAAMFLPFGSLVSRTNGRKLIQHLLNTTSFYDVERRGQTNSKFRYSKVEHC